MIYKRTNLNMNKIVTEVQEANEVDKVIQSPYFYEYVMSVNDPFEYEEELFTFYETMYDNYYKGFF